MVNDGCGARSSPARNGLFSGAGICATLLAGASASSVQQSTRRGDWLAQQELVEERCASTVQHGGVLCDGNAGISICSTLAARIRLSVFLRRFTVLLLIVSFVPYNGERANSLAAPWTDVVLQLAVQTTNFAMNCKDYFGKQKGTRSHATIFVFTHAPVIAKHQIRLCTMT